MRSLSDELSGGKYFRIPKGRDYQSRTIVLGNDTKYRIDNEMMVNFRPINTQNMEYIPRARISVACGWRTVGAGIDLRVSFRL